MIKSLKDRADTEPNNNLNLYFNKDESIFIDPDDQNVSECRPEKDRKTFLLCLSGFCIPAKNLFSFSPLFVFKYI